jgi:sugar phosphate permease
MPFFASDILNIGAKGLGNLLACLGAGAITGAFLLGNLPVYYPRHHLIPLSMTVLGVFELLYSQSTSILLSYSVIYVTGIFWLWILVSCNTAMQLLVPDAIRGRTMSILLLANVGVLPFGHIAAGFMAKYISPQLTMIITSGLLILVGLVTLFNRIPEIDGYEAKGHPVKFHRFFSEVIMASSHRAEALALDRTKEK